MGYNGLIGHPDGVRVALIAPGFFHTVTAAELEALKLLHGTIKPVTASTYAYAKSSAVPDAGTYPQIDELPDRIPLTVEGASEEFINTIASQIVANTNTVGSQLAGVGATYRDQIRTHVTAEADRVIASE
jgi:hypothetical protein